MSEIFFVRHTQHSAHWSYSVHIRELTAVRDVKHKTDFTCNEIINSLRIEIFKGKMG